MNYIRVVYQFIWKLFIGPARFPIPDSRFQSFNSYNNKRLSRYLHFASLYN